MGPSNSLDHLDATAGIYLDFAFLLFSSNLYPQQSVDYSMHKKYFVFITLLIYAVPTQVFYGGLLLALLPYIITTKKSCSLLSLGKDTMKIHRFSHGTKYHD